MMENDKDERAEALTKVLLAEQMKRKSLERLSEELRFLLDKSDTILKQLASSRKVPSSAEQDAEQGPSSEGLSGKIGSSEKQDNSGEINDAGILDQIASLRSEIKAAQTSEQNERLLQSSLKISSNLNMDVVGPDGVALNLKPVKRKQRHGYPKTLLNEPSVSKGLLMRELNPRNGPFADIGVVLNRRKKRNKATLWKNKQPVVRAVLRLREETSIPGYNDIKAWRVLRQSNDASDREEDDDYLEQNRPSMSRRWRIHLKDSPSGSSFWDQFMLFPYGVPRTLENAIQTSDQLSEYFKIKTMNHSVEERRFRNRLRDFERKWQSFRPPDTGLAVPIPRNKVLAAGKALEPSLQPLKNDVEVFGESSFRLAVKLASRHRQRVTKSQTLSVVGEDSDANSSGSLSPRAEQNGADSENDVQLVDANGSDLDLNQSEEPVALPPVPVAQDRQQNLQRLSDPLQAPLGVPFTEQKVPQERGMSALSALHPPVALGRPVEGPTPGTQGTVFTSLNPPSSGDGGHFYSSYTVPGRSSSARNDSGTLGTLGAMATSQNQVTYNRDAFAASGTSGSGTRSFSDRVMPSKASQGTVAVASLGTIMEPNLGAKFGTVGGMTDSYQMPVGPGTMTGSNAGSLGTYNGPMMGALMGASGGVTPGTFTGNMMGTYKGTMGGTSLGTMVGTSLGTSTGGGYGNMMAASAGGMKGTWIGGSTGTKVGTSMGSMIGTRLGTKAGTSVGSVMGTSSTGYKAIARNFDYDPAKNLGTNPAIMVASGTFLSNKFGLRAGTSVQAGSPANYQTDLGSGFVSKVGRSLGTTVGTPLGIPTPRRGDPGTSFGTNYGTGFVSNLGKSSGALNTQSTTLGTNWRSNVGMPKAANFGTPLRQKRAGFDVRAQPRTSGPRMSFQGGTGTSDRDQGTFYNNAVPYASSNVGTLGQPNVTPMGTFSRQAGPQSLQSRAGGMGPSYFPSDPNMYSNSSPATAATRSLGTLSQRDGTLRVNNGNSRIWIARSAASDADMEPVTQNLLESLEFGSLSQGRGPAEKGDETGASQPGAVREARVFLGPRQSEGSSQGPYGSPGVSSYAGRGGGRLSMGRGLRRP